MKNMVARNFRGLNPEQMHACGGKLMPKGANGRPLDEIAFGNWVDDRVREFRAEQVATLVAQEKALVGSHAEAQRMVELYAQQLDRCQARMAGLRGKPRT